LYVSWYPFTHPQLGNIEIGGVDEFRLVSNPPSKFLFAEVKGHADFAVYQALLSPKLEILTATAVALHLSLSSHDSNTLTYKVTIGVANTGFLPTNVTNNASKIKAVLPVLVELRAEGDGVIKPADGYSPLFQQVVVQTSNFP
jgi:hypothetical protein